MSKEVKIKISIPKEDLNDFEKYARKHKTTLDNALVKVMRERIIEDKKKAQLKRELKKKDKDVATSTFEELLDRYNIKLEDKEKSE